MKIKPLILLLAFAPIACNRSPTDPLVSGTGSKIIDLNSSGSYRGFAYNGSYRKGVIVTTNPGGNAGSLEIWFQEANSTSALTEWKATSENVSVDSLDPASERVLLRDVRYEKSIGAEGAVFPAVPLELRLTRAGSDAIRLEIASPSGLPAPLPLQDGTILLKKDVYVE